MINHCHPNFPSHLSITPNTGRVTKKAPLEDDSRDAFGVEAQQEAISKYGIAGRVWEAAHALCAYVDECDTHDFDPPFVDESNEPLAAIELGSGTGVVAASILRMMRCAAQSGGRVIATDLPDVCPLLEHNLGRNRSHSHPNTVFVRPLVWGNLDHAAAIASEFGFDQSLLTHIICSDLVYFPELFGPLLRTLIHLTSPPCMASTRLSAPKVIISYKIRSLSKETPFWMAFGLWFAFQPILTRRRPRLIERKDALPNDDLDESCQWRRFGADNDSDRTFVFVARRRPESIGWHIPKTDKELMEGIGARGTLAKKGDDTFETILFMSIVIDDTGAQKSASD